MALLSTVLVAVLLIIVVSNRSATPAAPESTTTSTSYVLPNSVVTHSVNVNHNETEQVVEVLAE